MPTLFISHASEDKATVARPLAESLRAAGYQVWYDEFELTIGDSLREEIDSGLVQCDFGVVVLSPSFFAKEWPRRELDALYTREIVGESKVILPVWHQLGVTDVTKHSPLLASKLGISTEKGLEAVVAEIIRAVARAGSPNVPTSPVISWATASDWVIGVIAPSLARGHHPSTGIRFRSRATFVNRSRRAAVLSFQLRFDLEADDPRKWVAIPEGEKHENGHIRVESEGFAVKELVFHFTEPDRYGGYEVIQKKKAWLWITDHITRKQTLISLPTPS